MGRIFFSCDEIVHSVPSSKNSVSSVFSHRCNRDGLVYTLCLFPRREEQSPLCFFRKCWPLYISDILNRDSSFYLSIFRCLITLCLFFHFSFFTCPPQLYIQFILSLIDGKTVFLTPPLSSLSVPVPLCLCVEK